MDQNPSGVDALTRRLMTDRHTRFLVSAHERYQGIHLKDLVVDELDDQRRMRVDGRTVVNFGSDSFLGLDRDPRVQAAIRDGLRWGTHNGASRVFYSVATAAEAERRLARWLGVDDTLIYLSVTLANLGALPGIAGRNSLLVVDGLAHDSVQSAAQLAGARGARVRELRPCRADELQSILASESSKGPVVAVDGVYSMTGDTPPLAALDAVTRAAGGVLYIDDAHGTGVIGEGGRGAACEALGHLRDVIAVGSLSKAFSCLGAFVTCTPELKLLLKMASNTYIFGGPVPPPYLEGIITVCELLESPEYPRLLERLRGLVSRLTAGVQSLGLSLQGGKGPIVSIVLGGANRAMAAGKWLFDRGYYVQSVAYPAVPLNYALLRILVNANHTPEAIDGLLGALADMAAAFGLRTTARSVAV